MYMYAWSCNIDVSCNKSTSKHLLTVPFHQRSIQERAKDPGVLFMDTDLPASFITYQMKSKIQFQSQGEITCP